MPPPDEFGFLDAHIRRVFAGEPTFRNRLGAFEAVFNQYWDNRPGFLTSEPEDLFHMNVSKLTDRPAREHLRGFLAKTMGFDDAFLQGLNTETEGFRIYREATPHKVGFGRFTLPRALFASTDPKKKITPGHLAYIMQSWDVDYSPRVEVGGSIFQAPAPVMNTTGRVIKPQYYQYGADTINEIKNKKIDFMGQRMVMLDVETAGLQRQGIWQIASQAFEGGAPSGPGLNLFIDNAAMDTGVWPGQKGFKRHFSEITRGAVAPEDFKDFKTQISTFLGSLRDDDIIVAQNASFDLDQMISDIKKYGIDKLKDDLGDKARGFITKAQTGKVIDLRMLLTAVTGEGMVDIAQELKNIEKATPASIENILLQTTAIRDITRKYLKDPAAAAWFLEGVDISDDALAAAGGNRIRAGIYEQLKSLHLGNVDIKFQQELFELAVQALQGNEKVLQYKPVTDPTLRKWIHGSAAATPFTKTPFRIRTGTGAIEVEATPIQMMSHHARGMSTTAQFLAGGHLSPEARMIKAGQLSAFVDEVLDESGNIRHGVRLAESPTFARLQNAAIEAGNVHRLSSPVELIMNTLLGKAGGTTLPAHTGYGGVREGIRGVNEIRNIIGDVFQGGIFQKTQKAMSFNKNIALPIELLMEANVDKLLGTSFGAGTQKLSLSSFRYHSGEAEISLVADIFNSGDDVKDLADAKKLAAAIRNLDPERLAYYGVESGMLDELLVKGPQHGIQVGILGGKGNAATQRVATFFEAINAQFDKKGNHIIDVMMALVPENFEKARGVKPGTLIGAVGAHFRTPKGLTEMPDDELARSAQYFTDLLRAVPKATEISSFWGAVQYASKRQGSEIAANVYQRLETIIPKAPKAIGFGLAAIGAALWLGGKKNNNDPYQDTFAQQPEQDFGYYQQYKRDLGDMVPIQDGIVARSSPSLQTATVVQRLDRNKIGHNKMGNDRYSHLY